MNKSQEEKFEAFIHLRDSLTTEGDAEFDGDIHGEAMDVFGEGVVRSAIEAWNQEILEGQMEAVKLMREVLGLN